MNCDNISYIWDIKTGYATRYGKYKTKIQRSFINKFVGEGLRILDVGGGSGRFAIELSIKNDVMVIDPNEEAILLLKHRAPIIESICTKFEDYHTKDVFDLILMIEVLQYFDNLEKIFKRVNQLLKVNGLFIFTILNHKSIKYLFKRISGRTRYPDIRNYNQYIKLLEKNGFRLVDVYGYNWLPVKVCSNNIFIPLFTKLENIFLLNRVPHFSPELLFAVQKQIDVCN